MSEPAQVPDFAGKVVLFYLANSPSSVEAGVTMEYIEPRLVGGRLFLVGRTPEQIGQEWVSQLQAGIAWDAVVHYVVFDSRDEFQARMGQVRHGLVERLFGRAG